MEDLGDAKALIGAGAQDRTRAGTVAI